jgi:hypothetical protein
MRTFVLRAMVVLAAGCASPAPPRQHPLAGDSALTDCRAAGADDDAEAIGCRRRSLISEPASGPGLVRSAGSPA